jgi:hypothetical protein
MFDRPSINACPQPASRALAMRVACPSLFPGGSVPFGALAFRTVLPYSTRTYDAPNNAPTGASPLPTPAAERPTACCIDEIPLAASPAEC